MAREIDVTIENKLAAGERDINVFHQSSRSAHIISHNSTVTLPLGNTDENDYLYISVARGPGYLWMDCVISLPAWADFDFSSEGKLVLTHSEDARRTFLRIPPGPPTWKLKITRSVGLGLWSANPLTVVQGEHEHVTISDNGNGEGG
jgi:hypothetical protein